MQEISFFFVLFVDYFVYFYTIIRASNIILEGYNYAQS